MYDKIATFRRPEICVHRLKTSGLNRGWENLPALRQKLVPVIDRMAGYEPESINIYVGFPLFRCQFSG